MSNLRRNTLENERTAKDAVVPFMNAANPAMETINREEVDLPRNLPGCFQVRTMRHGNPWFTGGVKSKVRLYIPGSEIQRNHLAAFSRS
ncbi:MAG: hypothetical protein MZV63_58380 [Marinilabiliales bacterium]|nr:hypothetical protein [Marinilabiliales bacterium]